MATRKRLYDLTENASPQPTDYMVIDSSASAAARKVALSKFALLVGASVQDFGKVGIKADVIAESTAGSGVTIDVQFKIKDGNASATDTVYTDKIAEYSAGSGTLFETAIVVQEIADAEAPASGLYFSSSGKNLRYKYAGSTWAITVTSVQV